MVQNNEVMNNNPDVNFETGEIKTDMIVSETPEYKIVKQENGKYRKEMKYETYFSRQAETEEEKIELYKVFNDSNSDLVTPLSNMQNKEINIAHVFTQPYESFDEDTGKVFNGVTTTIESTDGSYYATSSKSVYHTIFNIMRTFGFPNDENYKPVKVEVTGIRRQNGVQIDLELKGLEEE